MIVQQSLSCLYSSLLLPHTQQGFNWSRMGRSSWGLKVAGSLMINEVRLCECVYKCVRMFALRRGVKWLRKATGSSGTAKSLPVTNHHLFKQHVQMSPCIYEEWGFCILLCPYLPANLIISVDHSFLVLFFHFHVSDVRSCFFLINCCSCKSVLRHDFSLHCSVSFTKLTLAKC